MSFKKFRWSQVYESSEEELVMFMKARNIDGERVHAETGEEPEEKRTETVTTIWCAEGSLSVRFESNKVSLQPGDALRIDADTVYKIYPGITDCAYYLTI